MEKRTAKIHFNKAGSGSITKRLTLPSTWTDDLEITETEREVNIYKMSDKIIITREDFKMDEKMVLEQVIKECEKEIKRTGFICDSDNIDRLVDVEVRKGIEALSTGEDVFEDNMNDYFDDICEEVNNFLKSNYKNVGYCEDNGDYIGYYYNNELNFDDVEALENHFHIGE